MKTIHIKNYVPLLEGNTVLNSDILKLKSLIKELYEYTLKDDPKFHFFFEEVDIVIRIDAEECLSKVKTYLRDKRIDFEEYDYPFPPEGKYGEGRDSIVANNFELLMTVFHANSVAAIILDEDKHFQYLERLIHTALNPKYYSHDQEGEQLLKLAKLKIGMQKIQKLLNTD